MRKHTLLVAVPAFIFGCLVTAGLTTTAMAQTQRKSVDIEIADGPRDHFFGKGGFYKAKPQKGIATKPLLRYRIVSSEADMNKYAALGYEVKFATSHSLSSEYVMDLH